MRTLLHQTELCAYIDNTAMYSGSTFFFFSQYFRALRIVLGFFTVVFNLVEPLHKFRYYIVA